MKSISILGAGNYSMALAHLLSQKDYKIILWTRNSEIAKSINHKNCNPFYLSDISLKNNVKAETDLFKVIKNTNYLINVLPTQCIREILSKIVHEISDKTIIINGSKGIEKNTLKTISEIFYEIFPSHLHNKLTYLSGPSFAKELIYKKITAVTLSSYNLKIAVKVKDLFEQSYFKIFISNDVIGNELCGSLKNVMAIAAGILEGLDLGQNTRAAFITGALYEITQIGLKKGANLNTFLGLSGIGDLLLTCTSNISRNYSLGKELSKNKNLNQILSKMNTIAEGVETTESAYFLIKQLNIKAPIIEGVYSVLYKKNSVKEMMKKILKNYYKII